MKSVNSQLVERFPVLKELRPLISEFNPLAPEEIHKIEELLGIRLPEAYREFLLEIGGAGFRLGGLFPTIEETCGGDRETFDRFFGAECEESYCVFRNIVNYRDRLNNNLIPVGEDLFGNLLCLGIAGQERERIYFLDMGCDKPCLAAETFEDFLVSLEIDEE